MPPRCLHSLSIMSINSRKPYLAVVMPVLGETKICISFDENSNMNNPIIGFIKPLECIVDGETYKNSPPYGPPEHLESLTDEELKNLQRTYYGEDIANTMYSYKSIKIIEDPYPAHVKHPTKDTLNSINICGIDGSNQRVERSTFYFIIARAAIVEFRYSGTNEKPYFYNKTIDANTIVWVDGNVFTNDILLYTDQLKSSKDGNVDILSKVANRTDRPFLVKHDPNKIDKSPSSHALGWSVKIQQVLELDCLRHIPLDIETVCIKDGPLFSTSVSPQDTIDGLNPIFSWKENQILIACSKRIKDSSLLVELLKKNAELRKFWFPNQNLSEYDLKYISTDSVILPRILKPGQRTPLMEAVPVARQKIVTLEPRFMPVTCYYLSNHQPHTYIRIEIPKFMYDRNPKAIENAISIVAWQHELGHRAPLVQMAADMRCQLGYEKQILEKQTIAYLHSNNLDFPEDY